MEKKMNPIDHIIKEKLEGLNVPIEPDAWQLMEQKLEEDGMGGVSQGKPVADTRNVDEAVFEKLHRYEASFQPGHWQRMEAMLEEAFAWPRQVLRYKLAEMALMLLLFLLLWQHTPAGPAAGGNSPQAMEGASSDTFSGKGGTIGAGDKPAKALAPIERSRTSDDDAHTEAPASAPSGDITGGSGHSAAGKGITALNDKLAPSGRTLATGKHEARSFNPFLPLGRHLVLLDGPQYSLPANAVFRIPSSPLTELAWLETLPAELAYESFGDAGEATFRKNKGRRALRVGMFGSAEYNYITVPSSQEKKLEEELQRYAMGYGGGLSVGLELGRFEIETGAIYAARQYPVGLLYVNGNIRDGLQGQRLQASELNIINVPIHFRYNFLHRGSWRAYALAGASLQVAFQRNYFVTEEPEYGYRPQPGQTPPPPAPLPGDEPAIDRIRKSGLGWFEGGTFEENAYLTGNLGIGLERYINSRWSVFAQPTYQHSLQYFRVGLGPNADQINSLSILFGAKVRLK